MYIVLLQIIQGLVNVQIEHHPTIGDIISNKMYKVDAQNLQKGTFTNPRYIILGLTNKLTGNLPGVPLGTATGGCVPLQRCRETPPLACRRQPSEGG